MDPEAETKVVMQAVVILNVETTVMEVVNVSSFYARNHSYFGSMFLLTDGSGPRISRPTAKLYVCGN
jgi:hypothetical protein